MRTAGPCTAYVLAYQIKYQVSVKHVGSQQGRLVLSPDEPWTLTDHRSEDDIARSLALWTVDTGSLAVHWHASAALRLLGSPESRVQASLEPRHNRRGTGRSNAGELDGLCGRRTVPVR